MGLGEWSISGRDLDARQFAHRRLHLLLDYTAPVCGNAAQRPHGQVSADGAKNLIDSVDYIVSRVWTDEAGRDRAGMVLIQEQQIFAARDAQKGDARPGGYVTTGGQAGVIGAVGYDGPPRLTYLPQTRNRFSSEVNISRLPAKTTRRRREATLPRSLDQGRRRFFFLMRRSPRRQSSSDDVDIDLDSEVDLVARIAHNLRHAPLAGFVVEGLAPYGIMTSVARHPLMLRAVHSGMAVVRVGRQ